jgi:hypothetical protein
MFYMMRVALCRHQPAGGVMTPPEPDATTSQKPRRISQAHWDELTIGSAIHPDVIMERRYLSVPARLVPIEAFADYQQRDGLIIPIVSVSQDIWTIQLKPDHPRTSNGRPIKYETAAKRPQCIDVPHSALPWINDPGTPLWITEGAKKVDSAVSNGIDCIIGLQGVYGWRGRNGVGGKTALADWEGIALNERDIVIAFDSDCMTKTQVRDALIRLAAFLRSRGARVGYCIMPALPNGDKCGLDDFFAGGGTFDQLCDHLTETLPPLDAPDDEAVPELLRVSDVAPEPIDWLWRGWIPRKMLTILGGYGGDGKSTVMASLIGALTTGGTLPDGTRAARTNVLMLSAEDDIACAIRPRLDIHGADSERVLVLKGTRVPDGASRWLDLQRDVTMMQAIITDHDIGLVVIDPLSSYLPNADRNSKGDIRDALQPLIGLMERTGVGIVGVMHVGKSGDGRRASQRLLGSTAFTALARSVLMVADLPDDQQPEDVETQGKVKVLQVVKSNYAIAPPPLTFRRPLNAAIAWQGASTIGIEECFATGTTKRGPEPQKRKDAEVLLREMLSNGPMAVAEVVSAAKELGLSDRTVRRAKSSVGVSAFKQTYEGPWMWKLLPSGQAGQVSPWCPKPGQMEEMALNPCIHRE